MEESKRDEGGKAGGGEGEAHAFVSTCFREHEEELYQLASGIVESRDDAEDVVMSVLMAVLRRAENDPSILIPSYIFGSVKQEARKHRHRHRDRSRRKGLTAAELRELHGQPPPDPERVLRMKESEETLSAALALLPKGQRQAFEALHLNGLKLAEAEERLGTTKSNVRKQADRARRQLEEHFRSLGITSIGDIGRRGGEGDSA